ncbi:MAG: hypothetical protein WBK76_02385 [Candidatus Saccharimonadales bacterium]
MRRDRTKDSEPGEHAERQPRSVEVFAVLDLDRTLMQSGVLTDLLCMQLLNHGVSIDQVRRDIDFVRRSDGMSFSTLDYIQAQYGPAKYASVMHEIEAIVKDGGLKEELLCEGTLGLLTALESQDVPYAVLTYGERINQEFKLTLLRHMVNRSARELHATVTSETKKASWIASGEWKHEGEDGFAVPAFIYPQADLRAKYVVVIDDKQTNLESDDDAVLGILVDNAHGSGALTTAEVAGLLKGGMDLLAVADISPSRAA